MIKKAESYLEKLCIEIPERCVGSEGNRQAAKFFAQYASRYGFETRLQDFECMDWSQDGTSLRGGQKSYSVYASPYSNGCRVKSVLTVVANLKQLLEQQITGTVVLLQGDIAQEQLMPKNFPFYNPEEHQKIIKLLEEKEPLAIVSATGRNPEVAGAVYPFPLIEDGDFDIPSVYMTEEEGSRLAQQEGEEVFLEIRAERKPAMGYNVIAEKKGSCSSAQKIVLCAHIDSKRGSPGAIDNGAGIVVLLLLAELLAGYKGEIGIEIVALNGEDYYSNPGEVIYLEETDFSEIMLGINLDGVGFFQGDTAFSLYGCSLELEETICSQLLNREGFVEGEPWQQGDHALFIFNNRSALALTSAEVMGEVLHSIAHTPKDRPEIIDCEKLAQIALGLKTFLSQLCF